MKKVFLAAPFKSLVNSKTMSMDEEKKNEIVNLIEFLEKKGYSVHNAHKREAWGQEFMSPEQCTKIDYDEIEKCDIFIAFPGIPASPGTHEGLLVDMSGGTGKICLYLDGLMDHNKQYTDYYQLPSPTEFNEEVVSGLKHMQLMGGKEQVEYWPEDNDAYIRAKWFKEGYGRAYLGYTEAMSNMGDYTNNLDFKVISYCKEDNIPVFYGDVVGVNSKIDNEKKDAAIKLANVIGNTETMVKAVSPDNNNPYPQYLLPARKSVYQTMGNVYPIYNELYSIVNQPENKLFLLGVSAEEWMNEAKENLAGLLN